MEPVAAAPNLSSVPTEILLSILSVLPSRALLPVLPVNRRFYSAAVRLLHARLIKAAALQDHRLILECYHPSAKISTPYLYCDYLSTDNLQIEDGPDGESASGLPRPTIADLGQIYSHFRPVIQEENRRPRLRYPRRAPPAQPSGSGDGGGSSSQTSSRAEQQEATFPTQDIYLDENQLFSQLCTITNLVKLGPKPGLFVSHVNVSDGIIRVFREWLGRQAAMADKSNTEIIWADTSQTVGLRFRVTQKDMPPSEYNPPPVLMAADEEPPVAYRLELEELVVRATHLLLAMEKSELQEFSTSGNAVMISAVEF
ncbi:hypothetical protein V8F06_007813 [Rhypophila decipiens]